MPLVDALTLEPAMAEETFLRRELHLRWQQVSPDELRSALSHGKPRVVLMSDPNLYSQSLKTASPRSTVVLQISDESYTESRRAIANLKSVRAIFRHYPAAAAAYPEITRAALGFVRDARGSSVPARSVKPLYESGRRVRARMDAWKTATIPVYGLPLGYTNAFASSYFDNDDPRVTRDVSITFRGNRGLAPRILGIEAAMKIPYGRVELVDHAWSGALGESGDYVAELRSSSFALAPPGFVNGESFRYYEALLCGALPVEVRVSITHQGLLRFRSGATIRSADWTTAMRQVRAMPENERADRVERARSVLQQDVERSRDLLHRYLEV